MVQLLLQGPQLRQMLGLELEQPLGLLHKLVGQVLRLGLDF
jgi:aminoglycoside N3'-acetyltransferase